jgi:hypothetical protein
MVEQVTIRIHHQSSEGEWRDGEQDYSLKDFAGFLPDVGDMILEPGVLDGLDRNDPKNRRLLTVVQRVFNPRDMSDYVVLVVESRAPTDREQGVC